MTTIVTKPWYASKTVWAGILAVVLAAYNAGAAQFGWPAIPEFIYGVLGALGIYGRATATATLGK